MNDNDYRAWTDEKLIELKKKFSPQSEEHIRSAIELHRRQLKSHKEDSSTQKSIKWMTAIILVFTALTFLIVLFQLFYK